MEESKTSPWGRGHLVLTRTSSLIEGCVAVKDGQ
jgi:hypothetical protein